MRADWQADWLVQALQRRASDIHLTPGEPIYYRREGRLETSGEILNEAAWDAWCAHFLTADEQTILRSERHLDIVCRENRPLRFSFFFAGGKLCAGVRILYGLDDLPEDPDPALLVDAAALNEGLVLIGGATGSGKTTALMHVLAQMNERFSRHVITLEDPPELYLPAGRCLIRQRAVGTDVVDFTSGVWEALRADPDVLVIGELRHPETIHAALTAAETGHLVLATVHSATLPAMIGRLVHAFPAAAQTQVRYQIAATLRLAVAQRLLPVGVRRVLLRSYAWWTPALSRLVRDGKEAQLNGYLQTGGVQAQTFTQALQRARQMLSDGEKDDLEEQWRQCSDTTI